jgi:hypothetical protein
MGFSPGSFLSNLPMDAVATPACPTTSCRSPLSTFRRSLLPPPDVAKSVAASAIVLHTVDESSMQAASATFHLSTSFKRSSSRSLMPWPQRPLLVPDDPSSQAGKRRGFRLEKLGCAGLEQHAIPERSLSGRIVGLFSTDASSASRNQARGPHLGSTAGPLALTASFRFCSRFFSCFATRSFLLTCIFSKGSEPTSAGLRQNRF